MLSLSVLLLIEQDCGGDWRSTKSPATLRNKEMDEIRNKQSRS